MRKKKRLAIYHIDIVQELDGEGYYVTVPALPGCFSSGKTVEEATQHAREAIELHLAVAETLNKKKNAISSIS
jgi:predicted RNase H-like HicB family nuclease